MNPLQKKLYYIFLILIAVDISYSFRQHYAKTLDGDMAWNVIPSKDVKPILERPLGITAIAKNETYVNPNRFFCHWGFKEYLNNAPLFFQNFSQPITSVYLSCAFAKTITQVGLILLISLFITGTKKFMKFDFVLAAFLITALFQTNGFMAYMGVIDHSTTYLFFYGLPAAILLLYLLPFANKYLHNYSTKTSSFTKIVWPFLALVVCLSGPLNPGVILIMSLLLFLVKIVKNYNTASEPKLINSIKKIPKGYWFFLMPVVILSLYSLFLGKYNSLTISSQIPLIDMYKKIPLGIFELFLNNYGYPILFILLIINSFIINKINSDEGKKILRLISWIVVFSILYILLLPLGGYREYRPLILRNDTIIPITLGFIFCYGISTLFIIKNSTISQKRWYLPLIFLFIVFFLKHDDEKFYHNKCEIEALTKISNSNSDIIELDCDCTVLDWQFTAKPENSKLNSKLLLQWNIIDREKLYYHKEINKL